MDMNIYQVQNAYFVGENAFPVRLDILRTKTLPSNSQDVIISAYAYHDGSIHQHNKIAST